MDRRFQSLIFVGYQRDAGLLCGQGIHFRIT